MMTVKNETQEQLDLRHSKFGWTVAELSIAVNVDSSRIRQKLLAGEIRATKFGKVWVISDIEAKRVIAQYELERGS